MISKSLTAIQRQVPVIYNLFPRLVGTMPDWLQHAARAADMGFNWLFLNSILYPGFSGSLYAVKHHYRINPEFLPPNNDNNGLNLLEQTLHKFQDLGLFPMMDLVINHTARDSPLVQEHPGWYVRDKHGEITSPFALDPGDPSKVTVWGDLAEINNSGSSDKAGLWDYWAEMVKYYLRLGFKGFRCDAAYKVPAKLWRYLIEQAKEVNSDVVFIAETLGGMEKETLALSGAGFHYLFNSSKWWDFNQPWCLYQHNKFGKIAPSISFPETHDTTRLAADTNGNEAIQRQRYAFAAVFSAGLMMPVGYEFGFRERLNVVTTQPTNWEKPTFDLTSFVTKTNKFKLEHNLFHGEGHLRQIKNNASVLVLERQTEQPSHAHHKVIESSQTIPSVITRSPDLIGTTKQSPSQTGWILINKSGDMSVSVNLERIAALNEQHHLYRLCRDDSPISGEPLLNQTAILSPAEVALVF